MKILTPPLEDLLKIPQIFIEEKKKRQHCDNLTNF